jgi:lipopolysaccharide export system protein LptC
MEVKADGGEVHKDQEEYQLEQVVRGVHLEMQLKQQLLICKYNDKLSLMSYN